MEKAKIYDPEKPSEMFPVQFNPNSLKYSILPNRHNGKGVRSQASGGGAEEGNLQNDPTGQTSQAALSVLLFFHTFFSESSYSDVRLEVDKLRAFVRYSGSSGGENDPKIGFSWGTLTHIGTLDSFSVTYQMFASDGTPVQAEVSISITGEDPDRAAAQQNRVRKEKAARRAEPEDGGGGSPQADWDWLFL